MRILYIYRHPNLGYSIGKVFHPIEEEMKKHANVDSIYLPIPNYNIKGLWKNIRYVLKHCKNKQYDIIHVTGTENYLLPFLFEKKVVVTVHDLGRLLNLRGLRKFRYWLMQVATLKFANAITCISTKTLNEVKHNISIKERKITVIPNEIDEKFCLVPQKFNYEYPTILHIGTTPNKNLENTIMALKDFKCKLRIIGELNESYINLLQAYNIDYSVVYGLSDEEILQEYINADIINFPSLYEGFGMPIIEGQATGRLVITSNIEPMKSVAGSGAILCNPYDIESIRNAYIKGINDKDYREYIINIGVENVKNYKLKHIAKEYYNLYNSL